MKDGGRAERERERERGRREREAGWRRGAGAEIMVGGWRPMGP